MQTQGHLEDLTRLQELAAGTEDFETIAWVRLREGEARLEDGTAEEAAATAAAALAATRAYGRSALISQAVELEARRLWRAGFSDAALNTLRTLIDSDTTFRWYQQRARLLLTEILLDAGRPAEARKEIDRLQEEPMEAVIGRLEVQRIEALVLAAEGDVSAAEALLRQVIERAVAAEYRRLAHLAETQLAAITGAAIG
jgi:hypothetical protein